MDSEALTSSIIGIWTCVASPAGGVSAMLLETVTPPAGGGGLRRHLLDQLVVFDALPDPPHLAIDETVSFCCAPPPLPSVGVSM